MTKRFGFVFPGQGSQYVGMGADVLRHSPTLRRTLRRVTALTGYDVGTVMLAGPPERLTETAMTQLSVFALSTSLATELTRQGVVPSVVAGHSLGEFSALVAGGWLDLDDALVAVARRAEAMARACDVSDGAMSAVLGLDPDVLAEICVGGVVVANFNSPVQAVISGPRAAVAAAGAAMRERGATDVIPLTVGGAFHSPLMAPAEAELAPVITELPLRTGQVPLVSSITGALVTDVHTYRRELAGQIITPVRWTGVMSVLADLAIDEFVEVGPGRALRGLLKRTNRQRLVASCGTWADCRDLGAAADTALRLTA